MKQTIAMIIGHQGFRDEEYWIPKQAFEDAGFSVDTISSKTKPATSKFGKPAAVNRLLEKTQAQDYVAVVFVGGQGSREYFDHPLAHRLATDAAAQGRVVAAICLAPVILAKAGLLRGKQATVFPDNQSEIEQGGARYTRQLVEQDGRIVTANGPEASIAFAQKIIGLLKAA